MSTVVSPQNGADIFLRTDIHGAGVLRYFFLYVIVKGLYDVTLLVLKHLERTGW